MSPPPGSAGGTSSARSTWKSAVGPRWRESHGRWWPESNRLDQFLVIGLEVAVVMGSYWIPMTTIDSAKPVKLDPSDLASQLGAWSEGKGPLYRQLAAALAQLLVDGAIRSGTLLPPERRLADRLSVSRGTVVNAYSRLEQQGWIRRVQGRGTIVTGPARSQVDGSIAPPDGFGHRCSIRRFAPSTCWSPYRRRCPRLSTSVTGCGSRVRSTSATTPSRLVSIHSGDGWRPGTASPGCRPIRNRS